MTTTPKSAVRRLLSVSAAAIAAIGMVALSAPAHAAPSSTVWVCKYVGTPGVDETLKRGKNPIEVSSNSVDPGENGQIDVGDQFADAQGRSVVVQIGGASPGADACSKTPRRLCRRTSRRSRATVRRIQVARAATSPSAWSAAGHCSSEPPSWRPRRSGVAGRLSVGDIDACRRPA
jgi:hypothetical protein